MENNRRMLVAFTIRLVRLGGKRYAEADTRGSRGSCAYGWH
jgi:hypothetical protein